MRRQVYGDSQVPNKPSTAKIPCSMSVTSARSSSVHFLSWVQSKLVKRQAASCIKIQLKLFGVWVHAVAAQRAGVDSRASHPVAKLLGKSQALADIVDKGSRVVGKLRCKADVPERIYIFHRRGGRWKGGVFTFFYLINKC